MSGPIPYGRQDIRDEDIAAVLEVLRSDWLTQGPLVPRFEAELAAACGAAHGCATSNASTALHLACKALDLGPGQRLWTSPITFVASASCALHCGAEVDFVDVDAASGLMALPALERKLAEAEEAGRLPQVLVPVHYAGRSCDMRRIGELAQRYGFRVIEDASHAIGARSGPEPVGSCRHSDITVFSFHPVKIITTAEGGIALCRDQRLAERLQLLRNHGITRDPERFEQASPGDWYYEQQTLGFNYRMTELQAALGISQLARLEHYVARRRQLAARYDALLEPLPVQTLAAGDDAQASAWHLYVVRLSCAEQRARVFAAMRAAGIGVNVHYIPVHLQPLYRRMGFAPGDFPAAEAFYDTVLSLPLHPNLSETEQDRVVAELQRALETPA